MAKTTKREKALYARHGELVDIKFARGLTDAEAQELEDIRTQLDEIQKPFYDMALANMLADLGLSDAPAQDGQEGAR